MPRYRYYLSTTKERISSDHALWEKPLPLERKAFSASSIGHDKNTISYGIYFQAVTDFLDREVFDAPALPDAPTCLKAVSSCPVEAVSVFLIKHGAFYHPARIEVTTSNAQYVFILNVAVSSLGRKYLAGEYQALAALGERVPLGFLPDVFIIGSGQSKSGHTLEMFLGRWLEGFYEFHLSSDAETHETQLVVWGENNNQLILSNPEIQTLYRKASMILSACYDPITACRIHPWHHAAGDFIIRPSKNNLDVKLITVRNYIPLLDQKQTGTSLSESEVMEALLIFFLDLTLRMRLDRLDGIGKMVWADNASVAPCIHGFFQGLDLSASINGLPGNFPAFFRSYLKACSSNDLQRLARDLVSGSYNEKADETEIIRSNLAAHVQLLNKFF